MKTLFSFSISFFGKLIGDGCGFSGKTCKRFLVQVCSILWLAFFLLLPFVSYSQPTLVKDINTKPFSTIGPQHLTTFNGVLYFSAQSTEHGRELWRSDGTDAGTYLLKNISAGKNSSNPEMFTVVGNTLYFVANQVHIEDYENNHFEHHYELWRTDGTMEGTLQVGYFPMQSPQTNMGYYTYTSLQLIATSNTLFFTVNNSPTGYELWKVNASSPSKVRDVSVEHFPYETDILKGVGNYLYFTAFGNSNTRDLWRTDGTTQGTIKLKESKATYDEGVSSLTAVGDMLFFALKDENGKELWKSNGTPQGTQLVKDIKPGPSGSYPGNLFNANGLLYFTIDTFTDSTYQLWKSDGTAAGTVLLKEGLIDPFIRTAVGNTIYFISLFQLWKSDGTPDGTVMLKSFQQEYNGTLHLTAVDSTVYIRFYAFGSYVVTLWKSDGTSQGTTLIQAFSPYENNVYYPYMAALQGSAYFVVGETLWKSAGTPASSQPVHPANVDVNQGSDPSSVLSVNGTIYFTVSDGSTGFELWKTDGTEANTLLVKRNGGSGLIQRGYLLTHMNNSVYIQIISYDLENRIVDIQLWKSDGTPQGTVLVKSFEAGMSNNSISEVLPWNGFIYFFIDKQLWKSDGTPQGTVLVKNINTTSEYYYIHMLPIWNNALYFKDQNSLWKSDGTPEGTQVIKSFDDNGIGNFTPVNGLLYFTSGSELWKTDGTPAGTLLVSSLSPSHSDNMVFFNGALYSGYSAYLYKTDVSTGVTTLIKTIVKYDQNDVENLTVVGNTLYFTYKSTHPDLFTYDELWKSDGTPEGTQVVKVIKAEVLKVVNNTLLFQVTEPSADRYSGQLWRSNGTAENTSLVAQLSVQLNVSAIAGNSVYFSANDSKIGYELWKYDVEACQQDPDKNLLVEGSTICVGETGKITIKGSQTGFTYQAYFSSIDSPASTAVPGGGDITLTIPAVNLYTGVNQFTIKAGGCILTPLTNMATITVTGNCNSQCSANGSILQEIWWNVAGSLVSDIPLDSPVSISYHLTSFETTTNAGNNYGERIRGYLCVPQNGSYTFYIAGDDRCALYLSTDDDPAKKIKIASVPYFTGVRQWNKYPSQKSVPIALQTGKKYYIEALHKEGPYLDNLSVGWQASAIDPITVIDGSNLSPYIPQGAGKITREYWANVTGSLVSDIPLNIIPTSSDELTLFETASNQANNYGQRIRGYLHPQVSGDYHFYIAGDDRCELYLSTDEDPAKKTKIASVPYFTGSRQWDKYSSQKTGEIYLVAGRKYYIEALHKEGPYADNLAVAWQMPTQTIISVIAGNYLSPFLPSPIVSIGRTGIEEVSATRKVSLYPNPFASKLTLSSSQQEKFYISLTDNLGRVVYQTCIQTTSAETDLHLAHLKQGMYIVKVSSEDGIVRVLKVVKK